MGCPFGLGADPAGNLLVMDQNASVVRKVWFHAMPMVTLTNLFPNSSGNYQVIVTDSSGSVTSDIANLSVAYPPIAPALVTGTGSRFVLTWPVFRPSVFQPQWTTNLMGNTWSNLGGTVSYSKTTNGILGQVDFSWTNHPQGFYRIVWVQ